MDNDLETEGAGEWESGKEERKERLREKQLLGSRSASHVVK